MAAETERALLTQADELGQLRRRVDELERMNRVLLRANGQLIDVFEQDKRELEDYQENLFYELYAQMKEHGNEIRYPVIESAEKAVERIVQEGKSLARFGDGEFSAIAGRIRHKFQTEADEALGKRLVEVLRTDREELLVGVADNYGSLERYTPQAKREIRRYLNHDVRAEHMQLLRPEKTYYDAYVTRPYLMYADRDTAACRERFRNLKRIWQDRRCVFVEGESTMLGVGNDLFDNAAEIRRIIAPAENAFRKYREIFAACMEQPKDSLFLIALGPTATVLAYDLCGCGYQAVDIGHLDLEYEWFLKGEGRRTPVEGKYNNELPGGEHPSRLEDGVYQKQILADCSK